MHLKRTAIAVVLIVFLATGCSKKQQPQTDADKTAATKTVETKPVAKKVVKMPRPKVITVDDRAAKKTPDGRLYYDYEGKRYWRNYNDGKYYLFSKSM
ncbi:MAG: hypothetical protein V4685_05625, partial [Bacteroidota bacterium]